MRKRGIAGRTEVLIHRVYASDQAHSSIEKAMIVLGLGEENVVRIPSDEAFRLNVAALARGHPGRHTVRVPADGRGGHSWNDVDDQRRSRCRDRGRVS